MGQVAFTLVQTLPAVQIKDGMVLISGAGWALCATPAIFRQFVENGRRDLDRWDVSVREPLQLKVRKLDH